MHAPAQCPERCAAAHNARVRQMGGCPLYNQQSLTSTEKCMGSHSIPQWQNQTSSAHACAGQTTQSTCNPSDNVCEAKGVKELGIRAGSCKRDEDADEGSYVFSSREHAMRVCNAHPVCAQGCCTALHSSTKLKDASVVRAHSLSRMQTLIKLAAQCSAPAGWLRCRLPQ